MLVFDLLLLGLGRRLLGRVVPAEHPERSAVAGVRLVTLHLVGVLGRVLAVGLWATDRGHVRFSSHFYRDILQESNREL